MIYRKRRGSQGQPGGFFTVQDSQNHVFSGPGYGDHILLRDEFGSQWRGSAERVSDDTVRYLFRDDHGHSIAGVSDGTGITLRDEKGKTWRGFVD